MDRELGERYRSRAGAAGYARKYRRGWIRRLSNWRELSIVARAVKAAGATGRVLDCPCGAGRLLPVLSPLAGRVTAVDLSAAMIAEARRAVARSLPADRIEFVLASVLDLPWPDRSFDLAVCHRLIHHLSAPERVRAVAELARVARNAVVLGFADSQTAKARRRGKRTACMTLSAEQLAEESRPHGLLLQRPVLRLNGLSSMVAVALLRRERSGDPSAT